jgi:hypothetical protein
MIPAFLDCESRLSTNEMFDLLLVFLEKVTLIFQEVWVPLVKSNVLCSMQMTSWNCSQLEMKFLQLSSIRSIVISNSEIFRSLTVHLWSNNCLNCLCNCLNTKFQLLTRQKSDSTDKNTKFQLSTGQKSDPMNVFWSTDARFYIGCKSPDTTRHHRLIKGVRDSAFL